MLLFIRRATFGLDTCNAVCIAGRRLVFASAVVVHIIVVGNSRRPSVAVCYDVLCVDVLLRSVTTDQCYGPSRTKGFS